jgi:PST family polysaccharide transporter
LKNNPYTPDGDIKKYTLGGIRWGMVDRGVNVIVQFIIGVILARLLPPKDFGLIGLAMIVVGFSQIAVDLGLGPALIQKKEITERHVRTCFSISSILGILIAIVTYFLAPLIATVLGTDQVIPIVQALSLLFVFKGLEITSFSLLTKKLDFKAIFYVNLIKAIIYGIITVFLALRGWGVWSLVIGNIIKNMVSLCLNFSLIRHSIIPLLGQQELKDLSRFGTGMTINKVFNYFALQGDFFLVGRLLGPYPLGIYTRAYNLMQMPTTQFISILSNVLFPATSVIQHDNAKTRRFFIKAMEIVSFITTPICFIIVVLAPEIIVGIYGRKWTDAIVPLQILSLAGFLRASYNVGGAFLRAKGLVYNLFLGNLIYGISMLIGVWIGAKFFGLVGASVAVCIAITLIWVCIMYFNSKSVGLELLQIFKIHLPGFILGVIAMILLFIVKTILIYFIDSPLAVLLICLPLALLLTVFLVRILPNKLLMDTPNQLKSMMKDLRIAPKFKQVVLKIIG